ncbi:MAG: sugar transferase [Anaerolineae bacterium]|nr:sugar transferase [Anaerolineae bacterium]MCO5203635.1 sugar transferase [Anaerolineae bacterium]
MLRRFSINYAVLSCLTDLVLTFFAFVLAVTVRPNLPEIPFLVTVNEVELPLWIFVVIPVSWVLVFLVASVYDPRRNYKFVDEIQLVTVAIILAALLSAGLFFLTFREFSRYLFITFILFNSVVLLGWRVIARIIFRMVHMPAAEKRVLIVGAGEVGRRVGDMIHEYSWTGLSLVGYLDDTLKTTDEVTVIGRIEDAPTVVNHEAINDVVIALPQEAYGRVNELVVTLRDAPVNMRVVPDYFSLALFQATVDDFGGVPMISLRDPALNDVQRFVKRLFDLVIAGVSLLLMLPVMGIIALAIRLDSPGPIIYRQKRVGENGRLFDMYKFRSMVVDADKLQHKVSRIDEKGRLTFKRRNDPRITRIGRILRRTSLDEILQLFNVFRGDMSLVGPRPELPWLVSQYEPWQHKRFAVPQGITGWWQVNGRSDKPLHLHTEDDLYYIQNYSLWMDFYILIKTPIVVVRGRGAF